MSSQRLRLKSDREIGSILRLAEKIWLTKPKSHNRTPAFYRHWWQQPSLERDEAPFVRLERAGEAEAMLGFLKLRWHEQTIYSALNFYTDPKLDTTEEHGLQLLWHWSKHCDCMIAAHPRTNLLPLFERAKWIRFDTQLLIKPLKVGGLRWLYGRRLGVQHAIISAARYLLGLLTPVSSVSANVRVQRVDRFDGEIDTLLARLREQYDFIDRNERRLTWQYLSWQPPIGHFDVYVVRSHQTGETVGYFVIRFGATTATVCEALALPRWWSEVLQAMKHEIQKDTSIALIAFETNLADALQAAQAAGFFTFRTIPNFAKLTGDTAPLLHAFEARQFSFSTGDSDGYLL